MDAAAGAWMACRAAAGVAGVVELAVAVVMPVMAAAVAAGFLVAVTLAVALAPPVAAAVARPSCVVDGWRPPEGDHRCSWADAMATLPGFPSFEAGPDSCCGGRSTPEGTEWLVRGKTICSCPVVVVRAVAPPFAMAQN